MVIGLRGNLTRISGNPVSPLEAQTKDIGVASQTLLTVFRSPKGYLGYGDDISSRDNFSSYKRNLIDIFSIAVFLHSSQEE